MLDLQSCNIRCGCDPWLDRLAIKFTCLHRFQHGHGWPSEVEDELLCAQWVAASLAAKANTLCTSAATDVKADRRCHMTLFYSFFGTQFASIHDTSTYH